MLAMKNGHFTAALQLMTRHKELVCMANNEGITPMQHSHNWNNEGICLALADCGATPIDPVPMDLDHLSQIASNAFSTRSSQDLDGISLALYLTEKLISQVDADDDDELGYVTNLFHNALHSDKNFRVLDACRKAGLDFTMPIHFHGSILCLRDTCLEITRDVNVIRKLMDLGVDMDSGIIRGRTPAIIIAAKNEDSRSRREEPDFFSEAAQLLSKESMEQLDHSGRAAIHIAARNGHTAMVDMMIKKGVNVDLMEDSPADPGTTPLHEACMSGYSDVVKLLMDAGANDTMKNSKGETPAHCAVLAEKFCKDLDPQLKIAVLKELKHLDLPGQDGQTPFMVSQTLGFSVSKDLMPLFLQRGVDLNRTDNQGMTALMLKADNHCYKDYIKPLIQAGANIHIADNSGNTVLHYALESGDAATARYLIKKGADYNRPNNQGKTAVHLAVEKGLDTVLELMTDIR